MTAPKSKSFSALQAAYQEDPGAFEAFVAGVLAAGKQAHPAEPVPALPALPQAPSTLGQVFRVYERVAVIQRRTMLNNILAMKLIVRRVLKAEPETVPLSEIGQSLPSMYQELAVRERTANLTSETEKREATILALRSTRSTLQQAKCVFRAAGLDLLDRYRAEGLAIPDCVEKFLKSKLRGEKQKRHYVTPADPDKVFADIFQAIEAKRSYDPAVYLALWLIAAFGLRQRELRDADWSHIVERNGGELWYHGGCGKNGQRIEVPAQSRAVQVLLKYRQPSGRCVDSHAGKRLNFFLRAHGLAHTQKAAHELRAYIGGRIFEQNPRGAQAWLRHSNLTVTEAAYCGRYARRPQIPSVL